jgi:hypothetical protein
MLMNTFEDDPKSGLGADADNGLSRKPVLPVPLIKYEIHYQLKA